MGRRLSSSTALSSSGGAHLLPGQLSPFGSGRFEVFFVSGAFTPKPGVTRVRVRVWSGGAGTTQDGRASGFSNLISASGGTRGVGDVPGVGGQGIGGDFQAKGGDGGAGEGGGGGAAGSELGDGGPGGIAAPLSHGGGGGAVGGKKGGDGGAAGPGTGASPFEPGFDNQVSTSGSAPRIGRDIEGAWLTKIAPLNALGLMIPFPGYAFFGGGGSANSNSAVLARSGGVGAGGGGGAAGNAADGSYGGDFGGGGGAAVPASGTYQGGFGGRHVTLTPEVNLNSLSIAPLDRLIGGGCGGGKGRAGSGGGGYARGELTVVPGQAIPITVGAQNLGLMVSGGLVVVEY